MKTRSCLTSLALALFCAGVTGDNTAAIAALAIDRKPAPEERGAVRAEVPHQFTGLVVGISDGDTISVMHNGRAHKVRLSDIDCPEKKQAFGERARQYTARAAFQKTVLVKVIGNDMYGRSLAEVVLPNKSNLNTKLLSEGLAWVYLNRSKDPLKHAAQRKAQSARRGLWQDKEPTPPWVYRKSQRST